MELRWMAEYTDNTVFHQFDPFTGVERSSEEIDRSRLSLIDLVDEQGKAILTQFYKPGMRVLYRHRVEQTAGGAKKVVYLLGWQRGDSMHVSMVEELGPGQYRITNTAEWLPNHPWLYAVQAVPADLLEVGSKAPTG